MKRALLLPAILFLSIISYGQKLADSTKLRLKMESLQRLKNDQMVDYPNYSLQHTAEQANVRDLRFKDNFEWLMATMKKYGAPTAKTLYAKDSMDIDRNAEWRMFVPTTFTHIFQTYPSLILEEETVQLIAKGLKKGQLKKDQLAHGVRTYRHSQPCISEEQKINRAMKAWGMEPFADKDFKECK